MDAGLDNYLTVGAILFALGALGFLTRRNLILMVLSAELMLHGVSLNFVAFGFAHQNHDGQAFAVFIITVAACEAALALALILGLYQRRKNLDVSLWQALREPPPDGPPRDQSTAAREPAERVDRLPAVRETRRTSAAGTPAGKAEAVANV